jgi:hypothetical protein
VQNFHTFHVISDELEDLFVELGTARPRLDPGQTNLANIEVRSCLDGLLGCLNDESIEALEELVLDAIRFGLKVREIKTAQKNLQGSIELPKPPVEGG